MNYRVTDQQERVIAQLSFEVMGLAPAAIFAMASEMYLSSLSANGERKVEFQIVVFGLIYLVAMLLLLFHLGEAKMKPSSTAADEVKNKPSAAYNTTKPDGRG